MKRSWFVLWSLLMVVVLSACAAAQPQGTPTMNPIYLTEAVQTVYAEMTQSAPAVQPTETPLSVDPAAQATLALPTVEPSSALATATALPTATVEPTSEPTVAPTFTPLPSATSIVQPAPTQGGDDIRVSLGGATYKDPFDNADGWAFSKDERTDMYVKDGSAVLVAFKPDYYYGWSQSWPKLKDFYIEIKVVTGAECSGQDKYGLIFRSPDPSQGYLAGLTCDGKYGLWYYDGKEEHYFVQWETSALILAGTNQTNRLGVKVVGDKISLYINGRLMREIIDTTYSEGKYGLVVGAVKTENFTVYVDSLEYWDIK